MTANINHGELHDEEAEFGPSQFCDDDPEIPFNPHVDPVGETPEENMARAGDEAGARQEAVEGDADAPVCTCEETLQEVCPVHSDHGTHDEDPLKVPLDGPDFPIIRRYTLGPYILAVAKTRIEGAWGAYVGSVGADHIAATEGVLENGTKVEESVARVMFPSYPYSDLPYAD